MIQGRNSRGDDGTMLWVMVMIYVKKYVSEWDIEGAKSCDVTRG